MSRCQALNRQVAAIDRHGRAIDERGGVGKQPLHGLADFCRVAEATDGMPPLDLPEQVGERRI